VVARTLSLSRRDLGLTPGFIPTQLLIGCTGFALGIGEYFILRPDPLIDSLSWRAVWVPALILLIGTGFTEEFVFRGVMQSASRDALGKVAILYVTVLFAVLHVGYKSAVDVAFVFGVGLFFAWVVMRTGSIMGATLSHGITNIALYLVVPFLGIAAVSAPSISVQNMQEFTIDFSQEVQHLQSLIPPPPVRPPASATATTTPAAASATATTTPAAASVAPAEPVQPTPTAVYTVQPGDTLASIASTHDTTVDELLRLNDLPEPNLLQAGQTIVLPPGPAAAATTTVHTVQAGETLAVIAAQYQTTVETLLELNHLADPNVIVVGEPLIVPRPP
jgi:LysM repeat protein